LPDPVSFLAALAGSNTAARWLTVANDGSTKLTLECSSTELGQILRLATAGSKLLKVTIEEQV
jgi:hypothetical protein